MDQKGSCLRESMNHRPDEVFDHMVCSAGRWFREYSQFDGRTGVGRHQSRIAQATPETPRLLTLD